MAVAAGERFPKALRLLTRREFLRVQEGGRKVAQGPLVALALRNGMEETRLGLTVSTKVGNAVARARIRRHLRELFRKRRGELPGGLDVVLIARASAAESDYDALARAYEGVTRRLRGMFS